MVTITEHGLGPDWILAPGIDLELKQYVLLGYLQRVQARFGERKLYPYLDELRVHLEQLLELRERRTMLAASFDREVIGLDLKRKELVRSAAEEDALLLVIDEVVRFAVPELRSMLNEGNGIREELAARIQFAPVGVLPLHAREGYLMLRQGREARVYDYRLSLLHSTAAPLRYRSVRTNYLGTWTIDLSHTCEQIKSELVRTVRQLPNPATFVFEADVRMPHIETFMPLAKQLVYDQLERPAA